MKSKLLSRSKLARLFAFLLAPLVGATASLATENSLCSAQETVWFNAQVTKSHELVSVCGAEDLKGDVAWLQFRMGVAGNPTIAWPAERRRSARAFTYRRYTRFRVTLLKFDFRIGDRDYAILEDDVSEDTPQYSLRLRVRKAGTETDLATYNLQPMAEPLSLMRFEHYVRTKPYNE